VSTISARISRTLAATDQLRRRGLEKAQQESRNRRRRRSGGRDAHRGEGARIESQRPARWTSCESGEHAEKGIALTASAAPVVTRTVTQRA
jgi:hypothetical protein